MLEAVVYSVLVSVPGSLAGDIGSNPARSGAVELEEVSSREVSVTEAN